MRVNLLIILLLMVISSSYASGDEPIYYTSYESNNGILCHGIHVGDKYFYARFSGRGELYENGTLETRIYDNTIITIEITEVSEGLTISSDGYTYAYNFTFSDRDYSQRKFRALNSIGSENYFVYLDWNAWRNTLNNITRSNIDHTLEKYPIYYKAPSQTQTTFTLTSFSDSSGDKSTISTIYNKTDGSLLSISSQTRTGVRGDFIHQISWWEISLISKRKFSEENVCPEPVTETSKSDDSSLFNFVYFVFLIPITRMKKNLKSL